MVKGKFKLKRKVVNAIPLKLAVAKFSYPEYLGLSEYSLKRKLRKDKEKEDSGLRHLMNYDLEKIIERKPEKANAFVIDKPHSEYVIKGYYGMGSTTEKYYPILYLKIKEGK